MMPDRNPQISVVIPVKNGKGTIGDCLDGIFTQTVKDLLEVIVIDSGSADGTLDVLRRYPVHLCTIPASDFNHGDTRNHGVRMARGEFVVMTVQDAKPADTQWIERMLEHFSDPHVAGVCGLQFVAHDLDKNPMQWFRPCSEPEPRVVHFPNPEEFRSLPPRTQTELCRWDDVTAMYRRSALLETPFQRVSFSEDEVWARDALSKGYALVYEPRAQVCHYHHETLPFRFKRAYTIHYHQYLHSHDSPLGDSLLRSLASCTYHLSKEPALSPLQKLRWMAYNVRMILASWLARWTFTLTLCLLGEKAVVVSHAYLCSKPPQPLKGGMRQERKQRQPACPRPRVFRLKKDR